MIENVFVEVSLIIILAVVIAGILRIFKQPIVISYIVTGILVSPYGFDLIKDTTSLTTFAHIGITMLLFIVGLNLNPRMVKDVGIISLVTAAGQVALTTFLGFIVGRALGFGTESSLYIALAFAFSSTIIIMKLLSDKGDIETLYGRITTGILITQDVIAIFILMFISSASGTVSGSTLDMVLMNLLKGTGLLVLLTMLGIYLLPKVVEVVARSQEFLFLFSLGWCLALANLFSYFNLSLEIGALLAGIALSMTPYHYEISSKMKHLRDFFIILFFILLGSQMVFENIGRYIVPIIAFSLFVMIGKPVIIMAIMGAMGYTKRNSFLTALTCAQVSEFSFIIIALGINVGHISNDVLALVTAVGLISITSSTYLILYSNKLYPLLSPFLSIFERKGAKKDDHRYHTNHDYDIIIFGHNRIGYNLVESARKLKKQFLVVDYDPQTVIGLAKEGIDCRYGDASDDELLNELNFERVSMVVSTIPDFDTNLMLVNKVKQRNRKSIIIVVSHQIEEAMRLYDEGASYVIMPHFLGAYHTAGLIEDYGPDPNKFLKEKMAHIKHLHQRKLIGHEHPRPEGYHS